jgi:hypothetical protein
MEACRSILDVHGDQSSVTVAVVYILLFCNKIRTAMEEECKSCQKEFFLKNQKLVNIMVR